MRAQLKMAAYGLVTMALAFVLDRVAPHWERAQRYIDRRCGVFEEWYEGR